jgi:ribonuclease P protein subunit POP4
LCAKLSKADFTGAKMQVSNALCSTLIGLSGLVVRETTRTLVLIQPDNKLKTVLKEGCVFQFSLPYKTTDGQPLAVNIWGDNILYKGAERTKVKFKEKFNLNLY